MMNSVTALIAWRYLWHKDKDSSISVMIRICFLGILIGTCALMMTLIITNGFEKVIHEKMRGINAQVVITCPGSKLDVGGISQAIKEQFSTYVKGVSGVSYKYVILDHDNTQSVLFLKGINPHAESSVTNLADKIITHKHPSLTSLLGPNMIIIGHKMAHEHHLRIGQTITIMVPEPRSKKKLALESKNVTIAGIFNIGLEEYDNNLAFIALDTLNQFFDERGVDTITLSLRADTDTYENDVIDRLSKRFAHLQVQSWKEQYPALVSSLKLEKYVMFLVLALITLVACMNMMSLLCMQIQSKRRDIAIFQAMGLPARALRNVFLFMGMMITVSASLCGMGLAAIGGYLLQRYPIQLPDVYYISYLPARMDAEIFLIVFIATLLLGFLATALPLRQSSRVSIAQVLRQE
jgi:lipoprotein-releasing system permease protein